MPTCALMECPLSQRRVRQNPCITSQPIRHRPTPLADYPSNSSDTYLMQFDAVSHTPHMAPPVTHTTHKYLLSPPALSLIPSHTQAQSTRERKERREGEGKGEAERKRRKKKERKRRMAATSCWRSSPVSCYFPMPSTSLEMKEAAPSFIFFKLKPWRSPKVDLRPQAIPSRAAAHGASPRHCEHIPEAQHHIPQPPMAMPMSFTFIHGHDYHGWIRLPTAHAWHIQHLEKVPYITRKP